MTLFRSDPKSPSKSQLDAITAFFSGEGANAIRQISKSNIADQLRMIADNVGENALAHIGGEKISDGARANYAHIARQVIFMEVLDEIEAQLKSKEIVLTERLTVI